MERGLNFVRASFRRLRKRNRNPASSSASAVARNDGQPRPGIVNRSKQNLGVTNRNSPPRRSSTRPIATPNGSAHGAETQNGSNTVVSASVPVNGVGGPEKQELESLRNEVQMLRKELVKCRETITKLQEKEKILRDRLSDQAQKQIIKGTKFEDLNMGENRPSQLVRRYGNLYSQTRLDTYDALDELPDISQFDDLKGKLLFSVVVIAFRSVQQTLAKVKKDLRSLLCLPTTTGLDGEEIDQCAKEMEDTVSIYLRKTVDTYDLSENTKEVHEQICDTLHDYPSLKTCEGLRQYVQECVRLNWSLVVQNPPLIIDFDSKVFKPDMHSRFHSSDPDSNQIQFLQWPALLEGENGPCLYKGVVVT